MFGGLRRGSYGGGCHPPLLTATFQSFFSGFPWRWELTIPAVVPWSYPAFWLTLTALNIQSVMGAIMAIGVALQTHSSRDFR